MKYEEFWNATLGEAIASVDGYLKRQEDQLRGIRKLCWHVVMPWLEKGQRGTEFDLFYINGDPTKEEIKAMRDAEQKAVVDELNRGREEYKILNSKF